MRRKKSLVRPDRAPIDPSHRLYNYRNHAAAMQADARGRVGLSETGTTAIDGSVALVQAAHPGPRRADPGSYFSDPETDVGEAPRPRRAPNLMAVLGRPAPAPSHQPGYPGGPGSAADGLKRGKSLLARRPGEAEESGLSILKRGETLRRKVRKQRLSNAEVAALVCSNLLGQSKPYTQFISRHS